MQLTLLTAIVKLFLKKPSETQELVQQVLSLATQVRSRDKACGWFVLFEIVGNYETPQEGSFGEVLIGRIQSKYKNRAS